MSTWISKSHSLIVGPGLGRTSNAFKYVQVRVAHKFRKCRAQFLVFICCLFCHNTTKQIALKCAQAKNIPVLIDADGLFLLCQDTSLVKGYAKCILTPNVMEFKLLYDSCVSDNVDACFSNRFIQMFKCAFTYVHSFRMRMFTMRARTTRHSKRNVRP